MLRWMVNGATREANESRFSLGDFGGERMESIMSFKAGPEHNGYIFECFAHNPTIEDRPELSVKVTLVVLCKYSHSSPLSCSR